MSLVVDTWGSNINPPSKTFSVTETLIATAITSGVAVTDTKNFFEKDCPFDVEVIDVQAFMRDITTSGIGTSGAIGVVAQVSTKVDSSPSSPIDPSWNTLMPSVECSGVAVDGVAFETSCENDPGTLDQTYVAIPAGGSFRVVLSNKMDSPGDVGTVEILVVAKCRPTNLKEQRYF